MSLKCHCPVCAEGRLGFIAHPMPHDQETVEVIAVCDSCRCVFYYHFFLEEMLTEVVIAVEAEESAKFAKPKKARHLTLVKA